MLIVDLHALQAIDLLHFINQVFLQVLRPADFQDFVRNNRPFGKLLTFLHEVSFEDDDMFCERDEMFFLRASVGIFQNNPPLPPNPSPHLAYSIDLGNLTRTLSPTPPLPPTHP